MYRQLNNQQSSFATEHHGLISQFLNEHGLPTDEYYDTVVFAYLAAVEEYFQCEAAPDFESIAHRYMGETLGMALAAEPAEVPMSALNPCECVFLEEQIASQADAAELVLSKLRFEETMRCFDRQEQAVLRLLMDGYSFRAVCRRVGIASQELTAMMVCIRRKAAQLAPCA